MQFGGRDVRDSLGRVVVELRPPGCLPRRAARWLRTREDWVMYLYRDRYVQCWWLPWVGMLPVSCGRRSSPQDDRVSDDYREVMMGLKKRDVCAKGGGARPALSAESKFLGKLPTLCEWLSATTYEDGSPRTPGYMWISNRGLGYEVTIFDPDGAVKLPCLGRTLDEALALAETHLRAEDAPWQEDQYLAQRRDQGRKKKGA